MGLEEALNKLKEKREELIKEAKRINERFLCKLYEGNALRRQLERVDETVPASWLIKKELNYLEFKISTEALTLKDEKEMIKKIREKESLLKKVVEIEKIKRKLSFIEKDMDGIEKEKEFVKKEIEKINIEIKNTYQKLREERKKEKIRERKRKEMEPYMGSFEKLTLSDICIIKKKA